MKGMLLPGAIKIFINYTKNLIKTVEIPIQKLAIVCILINILYLCHFPFTKVLKSITQEDCSSNCC